MQHREQDESATENHRHRCRGSEALVRERRRARFVSIEDLARRVPELQKSELVLLAEIGALNFLNPESRMNRRDALWQVERAARPLSMSFPP